MASSIIGQLRVILGLDTAAFEKGLDDAERQLMRAGRSYEQIGKRLEGVGKSLSVGLTLPLVAIGGASLKMAANFEASMNRVEAATGATGKELKALRDQAKAFGADASVTATAAQTADVMEALAKNGRSATEILGGATEAVLKLAAANAAEFAPAADLTTDIMGQFGKQAGDLNGVVDKLTGGMLVSKFGFDDYRLAFGQAGAAAGALGITFEDTNVALAATSAMFASGSDAGTSFKSFLTSLTPKSKEAGEVMQQLGLRFFDASGKMLPVAEVAQLLRDKMAGLSDEAKNEALKTIFGTDAMRTAIGLMDQGAEGIARISGEVNKASAQDQMAARMKGWSGAIVQVQKSFESAAIALGDSGFLSGLTAVATSVADLIRLFAGLPQPVIAVIGVIAGVAAAVGPVIFLVGKLAGVWGSIIQLGPRLAIFFATTATGEAAVATGAATATTAVGGLRAALASLAPWVAVLTVLGVAIWAVAKASEGAAGASEEYRKQQAALAEIQKRSTDAVSKLAIATGKAREEALANARALKQETEQYLANARAALIAARAKAQQAKQNLAESLSHTDPRTSAGFASAMAGAGGSMGAGTPLPSQDVAKRTKEDEIAHANLRVANENLQETTNELKRIEAAIAAAAPPAVGTTNPSFGGGGAAGGRKGRSGPTPAELAAKREELRLQAEIEAAQARGDVRHAEALRLQLELRQRTKDYEDVGLKTGEARAAAEAEILELEKARAFTRAREIADDRLSLNLQLAQISGNTALAESLDQQQFIAARILFYRNQQYSVEMATLAAMTDQLRLDKARMAARAREREDAEASRRIEMARARGDSEKTIRDLEQAEEIRRRTNEYEAGAYGEGPMDRARAEERARSEVMEEEAARQTSIWRDTIRGGMRAALDGNFGSWFEGWWKDRVARGMENALNSLADLIQRLFSNIKIGNGSSGGDIFSLIGSVLGIGGGIEGSVKSGMGGFKAGLPKLAGGGTIRIGGMGGVDRNLLSINGRPTAMVSASESVSVTPANDRGSDPTIVQLTVGEGQMFEPRVQAISGNVAVKTVRAARDGAALQKRQGV